MFDPNIPQASTEIDAAQMRGQLNGLKALIDAIISIIAAVIDSVTTVNPGDPAAVTVSIGGTSNNTNSVTTLDTPFTNDPASMADMELMRARYNELVLAARR